MKVNDSYSKIFKDTNKILIVLAHPDDMEIVCGGIIARLTDDGKKVRLVVTTGGGKGTQEKKNISEKDFADVRIAEQLKAGEILGIPKNENFNLEIPDGEMETDINTIEKIVSHIREFKPDIVITHNSQDHIINFFTKSAWVNHRDHRHTALATLDAIYPYSRDTNFFPDQLSKGGLTTHKVNKILVADSYTKAELKFFDISKYIDKKKLALQQHISAFKPEDADDYIEENKIGNGYYEPLGFYTVY